MFKKTKEFFKTQLTQGADPRSLAWACTAGILIGNIPVLGATTVLSIFAAYYFRLNQAVVQVVNQLMWVSQVLLIPVFIRLGEWFVGAEPVALNPQTVVEDFAKDIPQFLANYGMAGLHAILGWSAVAPLTGYISFRVFLYLFQKMKFDSSKKSQ